MTTTQTRKIDFSRYEEFVAAVTSSASTNFVDFADRIGEADREGANIEASSYCWRWD